MLSRVTSPIDGTVKEMAARAGQQVARGELLLKIRPRRSRDEE